MAYAGNVFRAGAVLHCKNRFVDKLSRGRSDHVYAQDLVCVAIGEYLGEAVRLEICFRSGIRHEWELADLIIDTLFLQIFLRLADPTHFRMRVYNAWYAVIVDVNRA